MKEPTVQVNTCTTKDTQSHVAISFCKRKNSCQLTLEQINDLEQTTLEKIKLMCDLELKLKASDAALAAYLDKKQELARKMESTGLSSKCVM